ETTTVEGAAVLAALDGPEWERFQDEGVRYVRRFIPGLGLEWQAVFGTGDRDEVMRRCDRDGIEAEWTGAVLTTRTRRAAIIGDGQDRRAWFAQILHWHPYCLEPSARRRLVAEFGDELPRNCTYGDGSPIADDTVAALIGVSRKLEFRVDWQVGDLALLNNARVAHGRRPYRGDRNIIVALGDPASLAASRAASSGLRWSRVPQAHSLDQSSTPQARSANDASSPRRAARRSGSSAITRMRSKKVPMGATIGAAAATNEASEDGAAPNSARILVVASYSATSAGSRNSDTSYSPGVPGGTMRHTRWMAWTRLVKSSSPTRSASSASVSSATAGAPATGRTA